MKRIAAVLIVLSFPLVALAADTLGKTPVKTLSKTDVQVQPTGADGATLANIQANNTAIGSGGGIQEISGLVNSSLPTYSAGNIAMPSIDTGGRTYMTTDAATNLRSNITQVQGAVPSATNALFMTLTDGTTAYTGAKTGQLPSALGQTTMAGSTSVVLASNQSVISVTQGAPTGAATNRATPVNIASAGTTAIVCKGSLAVSQPLKLYQVHITSQSPVRCVIQYNDNATITKWGDAMTSAASPMATFACPGGFCALTTSATATTQQIEANCTNIDTVANDVGCDTSYCQAASGC